MSFIHQPDGSRAIFPHSIGALPAGTSVVDSVNAVTPTARGKKQDACRARGLQRPKGWPGKRVFDFVVSLLVIIVFLPLGVMIALLVKATSRGPILFRQTRVGFHGRSFTILKFRTMHPDAEARLTSDPDLLTLYLEGDCKILQALDPRITRFGRFLRRSSLDELPQVLNVLVGHMSLVGPRPVRPMELAQYAECESAYLAVRPGLTGLWQVSGRNHVKFPHRAHIDQEYARSCSLTLDLAILTRTVVAVISTDGAN